MATLTIELTEEREHRLLELAQGSGVTSEQLLQLVVENWLDRPRDDFAEATAYVLEKNAELYQRLA